MNNKEKSTMRTILGFCGVLALAMPALAQNNVPSQELYSQQPAVSTPVPNIHAPGAAAVTNSSSAVQPSTTAMPAGTSAGTMYSGNTVTAQPGTTATVPANGMNYYYYYPVGNTGRTYRMTAPGTYYYYTTASTPVYTTAPAQTYYTPARRGFPFGLFRRRFVQPMTPTYTTAAATTTPTYYYTNPGYYYTPTTYYTVPGATAPAGTYTSGVTAPATPSSAATPAYSPTTYTVPNENVPAGTATPSGTTPSGGLTPSRTIPAPPAINPR
jgi:hypothetical protein